MIEQIEGPSRLKKLDSEALVESQLIVSMNPNVYGWIAVVVSLDSDGVGFDYRWVRSINRNTRTLLPSSCVGSVLHDWRLLNG